MHYKTQSHQFMSYRYTQPYMQYKTVEKLLQTHTFYGKHSCQNSMFDWAETTVTRVSHKSEELITNFPYRK